MKHFLIPTIVFCLTLHNSYSQSYDSTTRFETYPMEVVKSSTWSIIDENTEGTLRFEDSSERSTLLILDAALRHCLITAKLIEYRNGIKIREVTMLSKEAIYNHPKFEPCEDSAFVFSLYRKPDKNGQLIWGFRTPSTMRTAKVDMSKPGDYWPYLTDLQDRILPIGKPFVFLVITDNHDDLPFFKTANKNNYRTSGSSKDFKLKHSFIIELTIEKSMEAKQNNQTDKA